MDKKNIGEILYCSSPKIVATLTNNFLCLLYVLCASDTAKTCC